jgi:hypothetical protein
MARDSGLDWVHSPPPVCCAPLAEERALADEGGAERCTNARSEEGDDIYDDGFGSWRAGTAWGQPEDIFIYGARHPFLTSESSPAPSKSCGWG